jgi:hypothetical protein
MKIFSHPPEFDLIAVAVFGAVATIAITIAVKSIRAVFRHWARRTSVHPPAASSPLPHTPFVAPPSHSPSPTPVVEPPREEQGLPIYSTLGIIYIDASERLSQRVITVKQIEALEDGSGGHMFFAYCHLRGEMRAFQI